MADKILGTLDAMRLKLSSLLTPKRCCILSTLSTLPCPEKYLSIPTLFWGRGGEGRGGKGRGGPLGASELLQK